MRKPFGVFILLSTGERWMFSRERTLADALAVARTLRMQGPSLFPLYKVWIAAPPVVGRKAPELLTK
jgi:hypothetical protein